MVTIIVFLIVIYAFIKKVDIYDSFIDGCKESFEIGYTLFPNLLAMILSINIFINSGIIEYILNIINFNYPIEIITLILSKPISGSASLSLLNNIFNKYGVDSLYGLLSSCIQGSTDTTFYVIALYYGSVGIKKIKYALVTSLIGDIISIGISIMLCYIAFS